MFNLIKRNKIYEDEWLVFFQDEVEFPDGSKGTYAWVNRKNGVGVVVVTSNNKILLNREYRYVIDKYSWEVPGGGIDHNENLKDAAKRELYEETGLKVEKLEYIGTFYPLNSFNKENVTFFYSIIEEQAPTTGEIEGSESVIEQKYVTFSQAQVMIDNGEISDAMTANALQIVIRRLQK